jgi:acetolactate synthase I/III small subunit
LWPWCSWWFRKSVPMLHTFVVYVDNKPGVLNRVASLFRRRAFNIESLTVGHTEETGVSRMTVVVDTDAYGARRLEANLYKLVPVKRVDDISAAPSIVRDLALIKVTATGEARTHVMQLVDVYRARVVDVAPESLVIETTGTEDKIDSLLEVLRPYGVIEMVRTGRIAMVRGNSRAVIRSSEPLSGDLIADDVSNCSV